jgi:hypothetical protein
MQGCHASVVSAPILTSISTTSDGAASLKIYAIAPTTPREDRTKNIKELQTMATEPAVPTFKEALKNDQAEFDDCTPCRVIGTASLSSAPSPSSLQKVNSTD